MDLSSTWQSGKAGDARTPHAAVSSADTFHRASVRSSTTSNPPTAAAARAVSVTSVNLCGPFSLLEYNYKTVTITTVAWPIQSMAMGKP